MVHLKKQIEDVKCMTDNASNKEAQCYVKCICIYFNFPLL